MLQKRAQTAPRGMYKNTLDIFKQTVKNEGFLALYKGMVGVFVLSPQRRPGQHASLDIGMTASQLVRR